MAPTEIKTLYLYISTTTHVVSMVLDVEWLEEGHTYGVQQPVYFLSEVLTEFEVHYN